MTQDATRNGRAILDVRAVREPGHATLVLAGELDLTTADCLVSVSRMLRPPPVDIDLDVAALRFCDAAGISALLAVRRDVERTGHMARVVNPTDGLLRLLRLLSLEDVCGTDC